MYRNIKMYMGKMMLNQWVGMALAFGVLFDAFVVRMMLIPALTKLFGKGSWYSHG